MSVKRIADFLAALLLLVILAPVLILLAAAIAVGMGRPVIFRQRRPGLGGNIFTLYKFRSMTNARDDSGNLLPDDQRLNRLGRFIRAASLDELPELLNVLKGDMSLVGPRPLLPEYLPHYTPEQNRRHDVPPGMTGWVQVKGRNALNWEEKFKLDVWYVDHWSLWLDLKILLLTVMTVIKREGISHANAATMPPFAIDAEAAETDHSEDS